LKEKIGAVPVYDYESCETTNKYPTSEYDYPVLVNTTIHLCSTGDSYGGNAAGGSDAGTPILGCNNNEDAVIVGIISDGIGCGRPDIDAGICNLSGRPSPPCSLDQQ